MSSSSDNSTIESSAFYIEEELGLSGFEPEFLRPPPCFPQIRQNDELFWVHPNVVHDLLWDTHMCSSRPKRENARDTQFKALLSKAYKEAFSDNDLSFFKSILASEGLYIVQSAGFSAKNLASLVEHNSIAAIELLVHLIFHRDRSLSSYLSVLLTMKTSIAAMEVVHRISSSVPQDFILMFVHNCLEGCDRADDPQRMARATCVFVQRLIKNNIDLGGLNPEIQSFCVHFSKLKEANTLYRLLRQVSAAAGSNAAPSPSSSTPPSSSSSSPSVPSPSSPTTQTSPSPTLSLASLSLTGGGGGSGSGGSSTTATGAGGEGQHPPYSPFGSSSAPNASRNSPSSMPQSSKKYIPPGSGSGGPSSPYSPSFVLPPPASGGGGFYSKE